MSDEKSEVVRDDSVNIEAEFTAITKAISQAEELQLMILQPFDPDPVELKNLTVQLNQQFNAIVDRCARFVDNPDFQALPDARIHEMLDFVNEKIPIIKNACKDANEVVRKYDDKTFLAVNADLLLTENQAAEMLKVLDEKTPAKESQASKKPLPPLPQRPEKIASQPPKRPPPILSSQRQERIVSQPPQMQENISPKIEERQRTEIAMKAVHEYSRIAADAAKVSTSRGNLYLKQRVEQFQAGEIYKALPEADRDHINKKLDQVLEKASQRTGSPTPPNVKYEKQAEIQEQVAPIKPAVQQTSGPINIGSHRAKPPPVFSDAVKKQDERRSTATPLSPASEPTTPTLGRASSGRR